MIQPGTHPDAESLTALAEQLLSGAEKEQLLAHMAVCSRCREIVFLAQRAAEAESPAPVLEEQTSRGSVARRWFGGWRWAWVPVAALAGFVGFAVVQHARHAASAPQQVAQYAPANTPVMNATAAKSVEAPAQQQAFKRSPANELESARKKDNQLGARDDRALNKKASEPARQKDQLLGGAGGSFGAATGQGFSSASTHGTIAVRAKVAPSMGGPAALNQLQAQNQVQQNNALQSQQINGALKTLQANNTLHLDAVRQSPSPVAANKPTTPPPPQSVNETVNVQAEPVVPVASAAAAAPVPQIASLQTEERTLGVANQLSRGKAAKLKLPGGASPLSATSAGRRTLAIDTTGALFLSEDSGKHWQPIKSQWTGRAVLVRAKLTGQPNAMLSLEQQSHFELVTDKLQTWSSPDGITWKLETPPAK